MACPFFYRHAGPKGPKEASIEKNARCVGDNPGNRGKMADQVSLIGLTGVTVLIDVTVEILLLLQNK